MAKGANAAAAAPETAEAPEREPVTVRGVGLMSLIAAAGDAGLMLTQEEGLDLVNSGYAVVDTSVTEGPTAKVTLTDAGRAQLGAAGATASPFVVRTDVPIPSDDQRKRKGRSSSYPFETLDVGGSFHTTPKDGESMDDLRARMLSNAASVRARLATGTGRMETVTVKEYQKDENGKFVKDANGKRIQTGEHQEQREVKEPNREFLVREVGAGDPDGAGVRVWRTK